MPKSMTGFSRIEMDSPEGKLFAEARSLNSRYLEISLKLPKSAYPLEQRLREAAKGQLKRGRLDVTIRWERANEFGTPTINENAVRWYVELAQRLKAEYDLEGALTVENVMGLKDILVYEENNLPEEHLFAVFEQLLARLNEDRIREGKLIDEDLRGRIGLIGVLVAEIEKQWPLAVKKHEEHLKEKVLQAACGGIDESRLLQELALYMERVDIAEEIVRLKGHLDYFGQALTSPDEMGRKLDFIIQEMVRETNTIASKSNDLYINERAIQIKVEIEKMREQVQNVE